MNMSNEAHSHALVVSGTSGQNDSPATVFSALLQIDPFTLSEWTVQSMDDDGDSVGSAGNWHTEFLTKIRLVYTAGQGSTNFQPSCSLWRNGQPLSAEEVEDVLTAVQARIKDHLQPHLSPGSQTPFNTELLLTPGSPTISSRGPNEFRAGSAHHSTSPFNVDVTVKKVGMGSRRKTIEYNVRIDSTSREDTSSPFPMGINSVRHPEDEENNSASRLAVLPADQEDGWTAQFTRRLSRWEV